MIAVKFTDIILHLNRVEPKHRLGPLGSFRIINILVFFVISFYMRRLEKLTIKDFTGNDLMVGLRT